MTHAYALRTGCLSKLGTLPADACVYVREGVSRTERSAIVRWLSANPKSTLRLSGPACQLLDGFDAPLPRSIELDRDAIPPESAPFATVERVTFAGSKHVGRWLQRFPNARIVRVVLHGETLDAESVASERLAALSVAEGTVTNVAALSRSIELRALELREIALDAFEPIGGLRALRSLRLCAVARLASIEGLRDHARLRSLWLERLPFLRRLDDLARLPVLESLDVSALWQFDMRDAEVLYDLPGLRRAGIDIGGKRKNVVVIQRLGLPQAPAFSLEREAWNRAN